MKNLEIFAVITVIFVALTIFLAWYGYRSTRDNGQFLLGKNKANPLLIALSYGATFLSTSAIVGFGGMGSRYGLALVWLAVLCILVGTIVAFLVFGKKTRRIGNKLGAQTFADLLGKRFNSPLIRTIVACIIIIGMPIYCAAVLLGGVGFVSVTCDVDKDTALIALSIIVMVYVAVGGVIAVMYNDALQAGIMFVGMVVILIVTFWKLGGVTEAFTSLQNVWDQVIADPTHASKYKGMIDQGMNGWAEMPDLGSPIWLMVVTTLLMGVGVGSIAQPQLAVRFMSAKDDKTLNRSMAIGAVFIFVILGTAFTIGPLSNVYFFQEHGLTALEYQSNADLVIPTFVDELFSNLAGGQIFYPIFILSMICATISTVAALLHAMGSAAGFDLWSQIQARRGMSTQNTNVKSLVSSRVSTVIMMIIVVIMAYVMPSNIIAKATTIFMGLTASAVLATFAYGLYSKNPDKRVALVSIIVGAVSWSAWAFFIESGTASKIGICQMIFGKTTLVTGLANSVDALVIGLPCSFVALVVAYFVFKGTGKLKGPASATE